MTITRNLERFLIFKFKIIFLKKRNVFFKKKLEYGFLVESTKICIVPISCKTNHTEANFNPLSANPTKWSNTLKQLSNNGQTSVFDHFVKLALKGLRKIRKAIGF